MIRIFNPHDKERRRRIKESQDLLIRLPYEPNFIKAKRLPLDVFKKNLSNYDGDMRFRIGDEMVIFLGYKYNLERYRNFIEALRDKEVYYSKLYKDLDGKIAQTSFKKL